MAQVFAAREAFNYPDGSIGYRPGGPFDCLGPWAKVKNCRIGHIEGLRLTCYATGYADTAFSIPACTRYRGQYIGGYFTQDDGLPEFRVYDRFAPRLFAHHAPDARYSLTLEWCGDSSQRLILRFCGQWVKKCESLRDALESAKSHNEGL